MTAAKITYIMLNDTWSVDCEITNLKNVEAVVAHFDSVPLPTKFSIRSWLHSFYTFPLRSLPERHGDILSPENLVLRLGTAAAPLTPTEGAAASSLRSIRASPPASTVGF
jgi:hypothetical protein